MKRDDKSWHIAEREISVHHYMDASAKRSIVIVSVCLLSAVQIADKPYWI
jgi:hypothetical protein